MSPEDWVRLDKTLHPKATNISRKHSQCLYQSHCRFPGFNPLPTNQPSLWWLLRDRQLSHVKLQIASYLKAESFRQHVLALDSWLTVGHNFRDCPQCVV